MADLLDFIKECGDWNRAFLVIKLTDQFFNPEFVCVLLDPLMVS